jgi:RimJ/RimL family protein N-acetyltransferase
VALELLPFTGMLPLKSYAKSIVLTLALIFSASGAYAITLEEAATRACVAVISAGRAPSDEVTRLTFKTKNLILRPAHSTEVDTIVALTKSPAVAHLLGTVDIDASEIRESFDYSPRNLTGILRTRFVSLAMIYERKVVGYISLAAQGENWPAQNMNLTVERGSEQWYAVDYAVDPLYRGRGFATEAVQKLADFFLSHVPRARLYGNALINNTASQAVLKNAGFQQIDSQDNYLHFIRRK